jgi:hypothetical protein
LAFGFALGLGFVPFCFCVLADSLRLGPEDFLPDAAKEESRPDKREQEFPELLTGISTWRSEKAALEIWQGIRRSADKKGEHVRAGYFVAAVELSPGNCLEIEDLGEHEDHLYFWGAPNALASAVRRLFAAEES